MSYLAKARARLQGSYLAQDEAGLSTVEYVILLVLIAAIAIGAWQTFARTVTGGLSRATDRINGDVVGADMGQQQQGPAPTGPGK